MNKIIVMYIKGTTYNPMKKWNSVEDFQKALDTNDNIPNENDIVVEAYIDDNLIDRGNTFKVTLEKLKLVLGIE